MVSISGELKLSEFELHRGSRGVLQYFLSLFAIDQLRKIKSHRMETIIHKMRRVKKDQTSQCFQFIRPFDLIIEDRMSSLQFLLPTPLSIKKLKPLPATAHVHRGKPLAFPFIPNIRMILGIKGKVSNIILILGTPCDLSCSSSC